MRKEAWEFVKINFKWLIGAGLFLVLYFQGCFGNRQSNQPIIVSDTTTRQIQQPIVIMPQYTPQQAGNTSYPIILPSNAQGVIPASTVDELIKQVYELNSKVNNLGNELYAFRTYKDSIELRDTAGRKVGVVNLEQGVTENKLKYTKPSYQLSFPERTITTTITQQAKLRNQVYIGGGFTFVPGGIANYQQIDLGLQFKNKKDVVLGIAPTYTLNNGQFGGRVSLYKKISFNVPKITPL